MLRPGNAGSNTAADHITVLYMAISALPEPARPRPDDPDSPRVLARSDSAGATHAFAAACRTRGIGFSFGFPVDQRVQAIVDVIPARFWEPAIDTDGEIRDGAWVTEATGLIDLGNWPAGSRLILRKERPHPGAQLTFADVDGHPCHRVPHRHATPRGPRTTRRAGVAPPSTRPRRRPHPPSQGNRAAQFAMRAWDENAAWLQAVLVATDLICWTKLICFQTVPTLATCEIAAFRYRVLHVAAQLVRTSRQLHLASTAPGAGRKPSPPRSQNYAPRSAERAHLDHP